jgi:UDP-2,3-diacylglucosamine pyrophosphatase LpxH
VKNYAISDVHADTSPDGAVAEARRFVARLVPGEALRVCGDAWSFAWDNTLDGMMANVNCQMFRNSLAAAFARGVSVALIDGNHDPYTTMSAVDSKRFLAWLGFKPSGFPCNAVALTSVGGKIQFSHGHQYDITAKIWPVVVNVLIAGLGVTRAMKFIRWVIGVWARRQSPSPMAMFERDPDAYKLMVPIIHNAAWKALLENKVGVTRAVFGHSHFDELRVKPMSGVVMANVGGWDGGGNTYALYDDATGELTVEKF